jgi:hypothetical protein
VSEFYFEDDSWKIRYLVVNVGNWLENRKVLIAPVAFEQPGESEFAVSLTREQVKTSAPVDLEKPISRKAEIDLHRHYAWPAYWSTFVGPNYPEPFTGAPRGNAALAAEEARQERKAKEQEQDETADNQHLRSSKEVIGYQVEASDDGVGKLDDFIVDTRDWVVRYAVVDRHPFLPGKRVLIAPQWIQDIDWGTSKVRVDVTAEQVKDSPGYDPAMPVNRAYEQRLYDFYGRPAYWT